MSSAIERLVKAWNRGTALDRRRALRMMIEYGRWPKSRKPFGRRSWDQALTLLDDSPPSSPMIPPSSDFETS